MPYLFCVTQKVLFDRFSKQEFLFDIETPNKNYDECFCTYYVGTKKKGNVAFAHT
jgi:hypothetical protein